MLSTFAKEKVGKRKVCWLIFSLRESFSSFAFFPSSPPPPPPPSRYEICISQLFHSRKKIHNENSHVKIVDITLKEGGEGERGWGRGGGGVGQFSI